MPNFFGSSMFKPYDVPGIGKSFERDNASASAAGAGAEAAYGVSGVDF